LGVVQSRAAIRKVAAALDGGRETRSYLKALRKAANGTMRVGTPEQRDALLEDW
jgi:Spy/CpxP family protein refolding chaperone